MSALALEIPGANLSTLNKLFTPADRRRGANFDPLAEFQPYIAKLAKEEQDFFAVDFHSNEFSDTRNQIRARIQSLVINPVFRAMFSATEQKLDLSAEMNRGAVILINCNKDFLQQGTEIFGRFFIALIREAIQARANIPERDRTPCYVYIDECQHYIASDSNVTEILETARKYRVGMLLAHQYLAQIGDEVQSALQGAAIKMVGQPTDRDIRSLASQLRTSQDFIQAQPIGTFATFVNGITDSAVALKVPFGGLRNKPKMTDRELEHVREQNRRRYGARPEIPFKVGDWVQITINGIDQLPQGAAITSIHDGGPPFVVVKGSASGVPMTAIRHMQRPPPTTEPATPGAPAQQTPEPSPSEIPNDPNERW